MTNTDNLVLYVSPSYQGSIHDKKLLEEEGVTFPPNIVLMHDLGYQGFNPENVEVIMPKKKKKGEALSALDKLLNQMISSIRVKVEHVIEKIKILRVLRDKIRIKGWQKRQEVFLIGCALNNLRVKSRKLNYNS
ncbi:MAG: transposase family protein [Bacteroidota bacterium]